MRRFHYRGRSRVSLLQLTRHLQSQQRVKALLRPSLTCTTSDGQHAKYHEELLQLCSSQHQCTYPKSCHILVVHWLTNLNYP